MAARGLEQAAEGFRRGDPEGLIAAVDGANCALYGLLCLLGVDGEEALSLGFEGIAEITREARGKLSDGR